MTTLRVWLSRLAALFGSARRDAALDEDIRAHLDRLEDEHRARGLSPQAAREAARRDFGGVEQMKELVRDERGLRLVEAVARDTRHAVRALRRAPAFASAAILTLALGIGANTAIFGVLYGVLLRPLPYAAAEELVLIHATRDMQGAQRATRLYYPLGELDAWRAEMRTFESLAFYATRTMAMTTSDGSEVIEAAVVSDAFFSTIRGRLVAGRALSAEDATAPVVVVQQRLRDRLWSGESGAVGRTVTLNSQPYTVIGVVGRDFEWPDRRTDLWLPASFVRTVDPACCGFLAVGRLRPGVSLQQARDESEGMFASLERRNPRLYGGTRASVVRVRDELVGAVEPVLLVLCAAAGLFLLVACANIANLILVRQFARRRELAVRAALGASRSRLALYSLVENAVLGGAGCVAGVLMAYGVVDVLLWLEPSGLPRLDAVRMDTPVLVFAAAVATVTMTSVSLIASGHVDQGRTALNTGGIANADHRGRFGHALVAVAVAVAVVLLIGAGLLGQSLVRLIQTDIGVMTEGVLAASLDFSLGRTMTDAGQAVRIDEMLRLVRALPGVTEAGVGGGLPPNASNVQVTLRRESRDFADYQATAIPCTPGYFTTLQMQLVSGRFFTESDGAGRPEVVILSAETARRFFPDVDPIGRTLELPVLRNGTAGSVEATIVGVVGTVKYSGLDAGANDTIYRPLAQQPWRSVYLVARTEGHPAALAPALRRAINADPGIAVLSLSPLTAVVSDAVAQPRFRTIVLTSLAGLAVAMASIGLYGLIAYSVAQRRAEMAIRMALGASQSAVVRSALRGTVILTLIGIAAGLASAAAVTRFLEGLLYGIAPLDVMTFVGASAILAAVTTIASYLPARRATKVDPLTALRCE